MPMGDSISRFDSSRDMFNIHTSPVERKIASRSKGQDGKDTIETQRTQAKRLGPIMILTRSTAGSGGRAVKVARAGRFIFFALALPPFLFLYSVPKWFAVKVLPQMFKQVEKGLHHAKQFFAQISKWLSEAINSPFRNILGRIKWRSGGVEKQNASLLSYMKERVVNMGVLIYRAGTKTLHTLTKLVEKPVVAIKEKLKLFSKEATKLTTLIASKATSVVQPMVNWMVPKVKYVTHGLKIALDWGKQRVLNTADAIKRTLLPKIKEAQRIFESIQTTVAQKTHALSLQIVQVAQPIINLCIPTMQFLKKHLSLGIGWLKKKPKEQLWNMHKRAQKFLSGVSPYAKEFYEKSNQQLKKMTAWFIGPFLRFLARLFPFVPWMFKWLGILLRKAFALVKVLLSATLKFIKKRTSKFHYIFIPIKNRGVNMMNYFVDEVKSLLKAPGTYLLGLVHKTLNLTLKVFKVLAIVIIGIGLVFKYWCIMLFELSEELGGWMQKRETSKS